MTENDTEANTALLLDEKIEERIHIAVGKLFGFDVTRTYLMPPQPSHTLSSQVRDYVMREVVREVSRMLVNDHDVVRGLYERMAMIQRDRRQQFYNTGHTGQQFF